MNTPEPTFSVRVDATNPGQFFACCGLLELAHRLCRHSPVEARFTTDQFDLLAPELGIGNEALWTIIDQLRQSDVEPDTTRGDRATHPVRIARFNLTLDWWLTPSGQKTPFKLWAGQQTSLKIVNDLRDALSSIRSACPLELFNAPVPLTGRFGFDPRAAWNALDVGFSPNDQQMQVATFPAVELLAAVGLQRFRPPAQSGEFCYATWEVYLSAPAASAAAAALIPIGLLRQYRFEIVDRGSYKGFGFSIPAQGEHS